MFKTKKKYILFIIIFFIVSCQKTKRLDLFFLDEYVLADSISFKNTIIGGLSGVDYSQGFYYFVVDDAEKPRFLKAKITIDNRKIKAFNFEDRPYLFIDSENGRKIKITPSLLKEQYRIKTEKFYHDIQQMCGQLKIDFVEVDTKDAFDKILGAYLVKRKKMR